MCRIAAVQVAADARRVAWETFLNVQSATSNGFISPLQVGVPRRASAMYAVHLMTKKDPIHDR